jgi:hypothetical protein
MYFTRRVGVPKNRADARTERMPVSEERKPAFQEQMPGTRSVARPQDRLKTASDSSTRYLMPRYSEKKRKE